MIIKQSNLFKSNSKPAIGQKVVVIRNNNKIYALPIGYNGNSFTVLNTDFFGNSNDISYVSGNNVKIFADNIISIQSQKLVYNGLCLNTLLNVNNPYGLLQLNSNNKIDYQYFPQKSVILNSNNKIQQEILPYDIPYPTFTLAIPHDQNNDTVTLIIDISQNGQFIQEETSASSSSDSTYNFEFTRISMKNALHRSCMKIFQNNKFVNIPNNGVGLDHYGQNVVVTLNKDIFPNYVKGKTYYARYTWMDMNGAYSDWKGFKFSSDVTDLANNENKLSETVNIYQKEISQEDLDSQNNLIDIDYLNGQIQYFKFSDIFSNEANIKIDVDNINNIPYGKSLKIILYKGDSLDSYNLTIVGQQDNSQQYLEQKKVMIQIFNYSYYVVSVNKII